MCWRRFDIGNLRFVRFSRFATCKNEVWLCLFRLNLKAWFWSVRLRNWLTTPNYVTWHACPCCIVDEQLAHSARHWWRLRRRLFLHCFHFCVTDWCLWWNNAHQVFAPCSLARRFFSFPFAVTCKHENYTKCPTGIYRSMSNSHIVAGSMAIAQMTFFLFASFCFFSDWLMIKTRLCGSSISRVLVGKVLDVRPIVKCFFYPLSSAFERENKNWFSSLLSLSLNKCVEICNLFILLRVKIYFD